MLRRSGAATGTQVEPGSVTVVPQVAVPTRWTPDDHGEAPAVPPQLGQLVQFQLVMAQCQLLCLMRLIGTDNGPLRSLEDHLQCPQRTGELGISCVMLCSWEPAT